MVGHRIWNNGQGFLIKLDVLSPLHKLIERAVSWKKKIQLTASPINVVVDEECIQFCDYYLRTMLQNERN